MFFLGIETSCDETAAAIVTDGKEILAQKLLSQIDEHAPYGGVVPEVAARAHIRYLEGLIAGVMVDAGLTFADLSAVAATAGPGLIGGVIVGLMTAKGIASAAAKPLIAVNHLEAHALTPRLCEDIPFPYLMLLVSGGHCQFVIVYGVGRYKRLGTTIDDAVGEAFDKIAKMLGLEYPGGPVVERLAKEGNPNAYALPFPLAREKGCNMSFSGLKTAVKRIIEQCQLPLAKNDIADICASFQHTIGDILSSRLERAIKLYQKECPNERRFVLAGGVAANHYLRNRLSKICGQEDYRFYVPPPALCTDNAVMVAWAGAERYAVGMTDPLTTVPRARWPLEEV